MWRLCVVQFVRLAKYISIKMSVEQSCGQTDKGLSTYLIRPLDFTYPTPLLDHPVITVAHGHVACLSVNGSLWLVASLIVDDLAFVTTGHAAYLDTNTARGWTLRFRGENEGQRSFLWYTHLNFRAALMLVCLYGEISCRIILLSTFWVFLRNVLNELWGKLRYSKCCQNHGFTTYRVPRPRPPFRALLLSLTFFHVFRFRFSHSVTHRL